MTYELHGSTDTRPAIGSRPVVAAAATKVERIISHDSWCGVWLNGARGRR